MKLEALIKQAQPGMPMDPAMMGMDPAMMGAAAPMPAPDMSAQPLPPGPPAAPTPEELMMAMGQGMPPADMMAPEAGNDQIIEKQVEVIDGLSKTVQKLVDINIATGSAPEDTADNVAAAIVGSGLLDGMSTESLPPIEEAPAI